MTARVRLACALAVAWLLTADASSAQQAVRSSLFRIFLVDGRVLVSHGEAVEVEARLVFTVAIGDSEGPMRLEAMSLPLDTVDLERTRRYTRTIRAAQYVSTRGEAEYAAMTEEVSRALDFLPSISDPQARLAAAETARRRVLAWPEAHYGYKAAEIGELAGLFDAVIAQLRVAAGEAGFSLSLTTDPAPASSVEESMQPSPTLRESIELALDAAASADVGAERLALVRAARDSMIGIEDADLKARVWMRLGEEMIADARHAQLAADLMARAERAAGRGDVQAIRDLHDELQRRSRALGGTRGADVANLAARLEATGAVAHRHRATLDRYASTRPQRLAYERRIRPVLSAFDGLTPVMFAIREARFVSYHTLERTEARLVDMARRLEATEVPEDLRTAADGLSSALVIAREACRSARLAATTGRAAQARDASSAAAGAVLLMGQARDTLVRGLFPPSLR